MFFDISTVSETRGFISLLPKCGACGLSTQCNTPKMEVDGDGRLEILIVDESPGEDEDDKGRPLVGKAGKLLASELRKHGIDMRRDCWITHSVICHPSKGGASSKHVECCRPNLIKALKELKPKVIILLGKFSVQSFVKHAWKENDAGSILQWAGWQVPCRDPNAWICPIWHPSYILNSEKDMRKPVIELMWDRHIKKAVKLAKKRKRPWENIPDESKEIVIELSPKSAARIIRKYTRDGSGLTSFDYETNMLKPDGADSEIVSCSICFDGTFTIAYPWHGRAIDETIRYLKSERPKAGANIKFEQRWSMAQAGTRVKAWEWDSVNNAHILDMRKGITSVKFQAFARMGTPAWDLKVHPYLTAKAPDVPNRIRECDLESLLLYNGVDALVEYRLALLQSKELGMKLKGT